MARSRWPEGVRRCPIACWKATFMYFMEIKQTLKKSFSKIFFRSTKKFESQNFRKCLEDFWKSKFSRLKIFKTQNKKNGFQEIFEIFETQKFSSIEKIFFKKLFFNVCFISIKYMNVAFQQAIGHLLTPSGRGERAIWNTNFMFFRWFSRFLIFQILEKI